MFEENSSIILQILRERELLTPDQFSEVEEEHSRTGKSIADTVIDMGYIDRNRVLQIVADYLTLDYLDLDNIEVPTDVIKMIPAGSARMHGIVPIAVFGNLIKITTRDPFNNNALQEISFVLNKDVELLVADPEKIDKFVETHYGDASTSVAEMLATLGNFQVESITEKTH